jgi:hypothetical protein
MMGLSFSTAYKCSVIRVGQFCVQKTPQGPEWGLESISLGALSMWPYRVKMDEEKSKHAGLAQQNGCGG